MSASVGSTLPSYRPAIHAASYLVIIAAQMIVFTPTDVTGRPQVDEVRWFADRLQFKTGERIETVYFEDIALGRELGTGKLHEFALRSACQSWTQFELPPTEAMMVNPCYLIIFIAWCCFGCKLGREHLMEPVKRRGLTAPR